VSPARAETGEVLLRGGLTNEGQVSRIGATVRRPWRETSPSTHALFAHLERMGFEGAPRFLGMDEHGREVLTYIEGEVPIAPCPEWALTDDALVSVAELLRRYHDAVASFDHGVLAWPRPAPDAFRGAIVSHNDPNLDNVVFADGRAVALIDFDLASPGSAVWDVACAARLWAPLRDERDIPEPVRTRSAQRLRTFVDAYGLPARNRAQVVDALLPAHDQAYDVVREAVAGGHRAFGDLWTDGGRERAERTRRWIAAHDREMRAALTYPA
jgi:hypothetical protein